MYLDYPMQDELSARTAIERQIVRSKHAVRLLEPDKVSVLINKRIHTVAVDGTYDKRLGLEQLFNAGIFSCSALHSTSP